MLLCVLVYFPSGDIVCSLCLSHSANLYLYNVCMSPSWLFQPCFPKEESSTYLKLHHGPPPALISDDCQWQPPLIQMIAPSPGAWISWRVPHSILKASRVRLPQLTEDHSPRLPWHTTPFPYSMNIASTLLCMAQVGEGGGWKCE